MAGSSGAVIRVFDDEDGRQLVSKTGDGRVVEQGMWLFTHRSDVLPQVYSMLSDGYVMERLVEFTGHTPEMVYEALYSGVWHKWPLQRTKNLIGFDWFELTRRLARAVQCVEPEYKTAYQLTNITIECMNILNDSWVHQLHDRGGPKLVQTHGDPTMENVMYRRGPNESIVLIDPLPARPYAPSLREVDLGKILQSLVGFEVDRYDVGSVDLDVARRWLTFVCVEEELSAEIVLWWTVVHLLRTFPYVDRPTRTRILNHSLQNTLKMIREARDAGYAYDL